MPRPAIDFIALRRSVTMPAVLALLHWSPHVVEPSGVRGPCPLHSAGDARSRSFSIADGVWYCHRCKLGGDALELYRRVKKLEIYEGAVEVALKLGVEVPYLSRRPRRPRAARHKNPEQ